MINKLQINPIFERIIPELSPDEFAQLEENILSEQRVIDPLITWNLVIVDGHNRFKILKKHPDIPFSVHEKDFANEDEVIVWICSHQLGRRNMNEIQRKCLVATRYESEKKLERFNGNRFTSANESRCGPKGHTYKTGRTREKLSEELGVTEKYIRNSVDVLKGVDAAEEAVPGVKKDFISGKIQTFEKNIKNLVKLPLEERVAAVTEMRNPQKKDKEKNSPTSSSSAKEKASKAHEIEENILGSMQGSVDLFISTYNNYFVRFPKIKEIEQYRKKAVDILITLKKYIETIEGELK